MISRMAKPEEVLVVENENGEVVREFMKDTDSINLYKNMRETLVYLTHLDYADTERVMTEKLQNQVSGTEWSWKNLNTVSTCVTCLSHLIFPNVIIDFMLNNIRSVCIKIALTEHKRMYTISFVLGFLQMHFLESFFIVRHRYRQV
jgi:exportin-1